MKSKRLLSWVALGFGLGSIGVHAQQSEEFTDPETGIIYQQVTQGTYTFGIALPESPTSDFIGRVSVQATQGWAGVSLAGRMSGSIMVVAWPNEGQIVSSLRKATGYSSPGVFSGTGSLKTISTADATSANIGYGLATAAVSSPSSPSSDLTFHSAGYGLFGVDITAARSSKFDEWAALAQEPGGSPGDPGSPDPGNGTVPISNSTYDYIVVGGGPAGLVASQRLTETGRSVLLLERGKASTASTGGTQFVPFNDSLTYYDVPGVFYSLATATQGEGYCTDTAAIAGCILGGGGSVNGMAFIHPPTWDFDDNWPEGWKWADVKAASERLYARNPGTTTPSRDGKWYDDETADVLGPWLESNGWNRADSIEETDDKTQSFGPSSVNIANGLRSGPIHTYLPLAQASGKFKLELNTKVIRVIRTGSNITGVEVETASGRLIINLNSGGSVVLAAGVMSTPRLLFNSGIGPAEQINNVKSGSSGVTLPPESDWIELPVGQGVRDHSRYGITFNVTNGLTTYSQDQLVHPSEADQSLFNEGSGVLTQSFQRVDAWRRITTTDGHKIMFQAYCNANQNDTITCGLLMTHGLTSVGILGIDGSGTTLFTKEPWANTDTDREAWTIYINELLDLARKPGSPLVFSGGANATADAILSTPVQPGIHIVGSTKIGTDDGRKNGTAVVDLNNKVYGTDNLFVVDASFHPDLPTGNTQAIVMVAAEHAVERIKSLQASGSSQRKRRVNSFSR